MEKMYKKLFEQVEQNRQLILDAERYIWKNPEPGYREWKTHAYLKKLYEDLGYTLHEAGNIPGFYTDIDTGRPGPTIAIFGELDSLIIPTHPECDPETGAVHACGHHCQSASLLGVAIAFKAPNALDGLCGKIRLIAVPAEEAIELQFRNELRRQGIIHYLAGKIEFLYRGYLDGVDMAMMVHTSSRTDAFFSCTNGSNGCIIKSAIFKGKSAHAGAAPHNGINALYAATNAMNIANALRETFKESDTVRFHPIITKGGNVVNAIPDEVKVESYIRAATMESMSEANKKVNCAFAGAAAAMGCELKLCDEHGMAPRYNDPNLQDAFHKVAAMFFDEDHLAFNDKWGTGCSDMGDISTVMPAVHPNCSGGYGSSHSTEFRITDPVMACVTNAKIQAGTAALLLSDNAKLAKKVISERKVVYPTVKDYFKAIDSTMINIDAVIKSSDGTITLKF